MAYNLEGSKKNIESDILLKKAEEGIKKLLESPSSSKKTDEIVKIFLDIDDELFKHLHHSHDLDKAMNDNKIKIEKLFSLIENNKERNEIRYLVIKNKIKKHLIDLATKYEQLEISKLTPNETKKSGELERDFEDDYFKAITVFPSFNDYIAKENRISLFFEILDEIKDGIKNISYYEFIKQFLEVVLRQSNYKKEDAIYKTWKTELDRRKLEMLSKIKDKKLEQEQKFLEDFFVYEVSNLYNSEDRNPSDFQTVIAAFELINPENRKKLLDVYFSRLLRIGAFLVKTPELTLKLLDLLPKEHRREIILTKTANNENLLFYVEDKFLLQLFSKLTIEEKIFALTHVNNKNENIFKRKITGNYEDVDNPVKARNIEILNQVINTIPPSSRFLILKQIIDQDPVYFIEYLNEFKKIFNITLKENFNYSDLFSIRYKENMNIKRKIYEALIPYDARFEVLCEAYRLSDLQQKANQKEFSAIANVAESSMDRTITKRANAHFENTIKTHPAFSKKFEESGKKEIEAFIAEQDLKFRKEFSDSLDFNESLVNVELEALEKLLKTTEEKLSFNLIQSISLMQSISKFISENKKILLSGNQFELQPKMQQLEQLIESIKNGSTRAVTKEEFQNVFGPLKDIFEHHFKKLRIQTKNIQLLAIEKDIKQSILDKIKNNLEMEKKDLLQTLKTLEDKTPKTKKDDEKITSINENLKHINAFLQFIEKNKVELIKGNKKLLDEMREIHFKANKERLEVARSDIAQIAWRAYDPYAPVRGSWPNLLTAPPLDERDRSSYRLDESRTLGENSDDIRERAAYYYLSAIDPIGSLENQADRMTDFIAGIAECRRGHNEDIVEHGKVVSRAVVQEDDPSCYPGHITRLLNTGRRHPIARLPKTPRDIIEEHVGGLVINKFTEKLKDLKTYKEKIALGNALVLMSDVSLDEIIKDPSRYPPQLLKIRDEFILFVFNFLLEGRDSRKALEDKFEKELGRKFGTEPLDQLLLDAYQSNPGGSYISASIAQIMTTFKDPTLASEQFPLLSDKAFEAQLTEAEKKKSADDIRHIIQLKKRENKNLHNIYDTISIVIFNQLKDLNEIESIELARALTINISGAPQSSYKAILDEIFDKIKTDKEQGFNQKQISYLKSLMDSPDKYNEFNKAILMSLEKTLAAEIEQHPFPLEGITYWEKSATQKEKGKGIDALETIALSRAEKNWVLHHTYNKILPVLQATFKSVLEKEQINKDQLIKMARAFSVEIVASNKKTEKEKMSELFDSLAEKNSQGVYTQKIISPQVKTLLDDLKKDQFENLMIRLNESLSEIPAFEKSKNLLFLRQSKQEPVQIRRKTDKDREVKIKDEDEKPKTDGTPKSQ